MNKSIEVIAQAINNAGGRLLMVGGAVRDSFLGIEPKDLDFEIFDLWPEEYLPILGAFGHVEHRGLGKFPTYGLKVIGLDLEFASPRIDNKVGPKHSDYEVTVNPCMSCYDAGKRRDYTINSMSIDVLSGAIFDYFGGQADLHNGILRATNEEHFGEDALRVLRGMQFAGRFDMVAWKETAELCASLKAEAAHLDKSAIWGEWFKWATKSTKPSAGMWFLLDTGWCPPELLALWGLEQEPIWHPEGDAWTHTMHAIDAAVRYYKMHGIDGMERVVNMFAVLCHDMGKPYTTSHDADGRIRSIGHEKAGIAPARSFLESIGCPEIIIGQVIPLVQEHMNYKGALASKKALRRLADRVCPATIRQLTYVVWADHAGRPPLPVDREDVLSELLRRAEADGCADCLPEVVKGRHLIAHGWTPGIHMGKALKECHRAWLNGKFNTPEEGVRFAGRAR